MTGQISIPDRSGMKIRFRQILKKNLSSAIYFFHEENIAPNNTKIPCSEFCAGSFSHHCYQMMQLNQTFEAIQVIGEGNGTPLQYSCLENSMDGGAWQAAVHEVAKSRTRLSDFTLTFHFHTLEKEMATHSSVLVWRIPGMGEPGGLPSMGSHRVGHD